MTDTVEFWTVEEQQEAGVIPAPAPPHCPACADTGLLIVYELPNGLALIVREDRKDIFKREHPDHDHYRVSAIKCSCFEARTAARRLSKVLMQDGVPEDVGRYTFEDFEDLPYARAALGLARQLAAGPVKVGEIEKPGLLIVGTNGCGKTTLGSVVFRARVDAGQAGAWVDYTTLKTKIRETYRDDYRGPSKEQLVDQVKDAAFLMFDDVGSKTRAERARTEADHLEADDITDAIYQILSHRSAKRLPTLVTTNLDKPQLYKQFGKSNVSRLIGLCHGATMIGADMRENPRVRYAMEGE